MSVRGLDAATVSDEQGTGIEVLRTSSTAWVGASDGTYPVFVTEADSYIRYVKVIHEDGLSDGTVQVIVTTLGAASGTNVSAAQSVVSTATNNAQDITITNPRVPKDSLVSIDFQSITPTDSIVVVQIGWMLDLWNQDANPRTYLSPG